MEKEWGYIFLFLMLWRHTGSLPLSSIAQDSHKGREHKPIIHVRGVSATLEEEHMVWDSIGRTITTSIRMLLCVWLQLTSGMCSVDQSHLTLCDLMDSSPPGSLSMGFPRQEYWSRFPFPSLDFWRKDKLLSSQCTTIFSNYFSFTVMNFLTRQHAKKCYKSICLY